MWYKLLNEEGEYRDKATGERKNLLEGTSFLNADGLNVGCYEFETLEEAMEYFNIEFLV